MGVENHIGLIFRDIENQDRYHAVRSDLGAKMTINEHEAVCGFSCEHGIGKTDFVEDTTESVGLLVGMCSPVAGVL